MTNTSPVLVPRMVAYKGEPCIVDKYTVMSSTEASSNEIQRVAITLRVKVGIVSSRG